jgi:type II secretory pathway pseudopilin PulG
MKARDDDRGETLIELIVALAIMGITVVAIVGGIATGIVMSDIHRKQATAGAVVRQYAEAIENDVAAGGGYRASCTPAYAAFAAPTGYVPQIFAVSFWNGSSFPSPCNAGTDIGLQQLTLRVASADSRATEQLVIVIRMPCGPGTSCA